MAVTTEDVAEAVKVLWFADTTLSHASTGLVKSLIYGRVPNVPTAPYATFKVTEGSEPLRTATGGYLQTFTVEFKIWIEVGAAGLGPIKLQLEAVFIKLTRTSVTLGSGRTLQLIHSVKQPGAFEEDEATKENKAVKSSTDRFEFLCQG